VRRDKLFFVERGKAEPNRFNDVLHAEGANPHFDRTLLRSRGQRHDAAGSWRYASNILSFFCIEFILAALPSGLARS